MEPLVEMPITSWETLRDSFTENWPEHLIAYKLIDTQLKYPGIRKYLELKIYCPHGEITNGIIAISDKEDMPQIMIMPLNDISTIEKSLRVTKIIDWSKPFIIQAASEETVQCLTRLKERLKVNFKCDEMVYKHFFDRKSKPFENLSCPPGTNCGPLTHQHLDLIDKTWTYTGSWSKRFFEVLMNNNLTYVLYSEKDEPLAWITIGTEGAFTHLYCLEEHRRKGYAEFITKYAVNDQLTSNSDVLAYTLQPNLKSQRLFDKLGFQIVGTAYWVFVEPE